ncbi:T-complex protein 10 C-terminus-domain-containing protein [Haematococcus lacustris]
MHSGPDAAEPDLSHISQTLRQLRAEQQGRGGGQLGRHQAVPQPLQADLPQIQCRDMAAGSSRHSGQPSHPLTNPNAAGSWAGVEPAAGGLQAVPPLRSMSGSGSLPTPPPHQSAPRISPLPTAPDAVLHPMCPGQSVQGAAAAAPATGMGISGASTPGSVGAQSWGSSSAGGATVAGEGAGSGCGSASSHTFGILRQLPSLPSSFQYSGVHHQQQQQQQQGWWGSEPTSQNGLYSQQPVQALLPTHPVQAMQQQQQARMQHAGPQQQQGQQWQQSAAQPCARLPSSLPSSGPAQPQDVVVREARHADGKHERFYASGKRVVDFGNGTRKVVLPGGATTITFAKGDVKHQLPWGTTQYYYKEVDTWHTTHASGVEVFHFPTGQREAHHPSGMKEILFADGAARRVTPDGLEQDVPATLLSGDVQQPAPVVQAGW